MIYKLVMPILIDCNEVVPWTPSVSLQMSIAFEAEDLEDAKAKIAAMFSNSALLATTTGFVE